MSSDLLSLESYPKTKERRHLSFLQLLPLQFVQILSFEGTISQVLYTLTLFLTANVTILTSLLVQFTCIKLPATPLFICKVIFRNETMFC